jgi:dinuclear metal center YbgI/SA1388 family protein
MKLHEIIRELEAFADTALQEGYDNSGLLVGAQDGEIDKALICLDLTDEVMEEAIGLECNLVISHHPFIFKPFKRVTGKHMQDRILIRAIKHEISIYAMHTNLDNVIHGVNAMLGRKLGLKNLKVLSPLKGNLRKLVTFCPVDHAEQVRNAMFEAGAGHIGNYDGCSYNTSGQGSFRAGEGTDPFVGEQGKLHFEDEIRIETIYPVHLEGPILEKMLESHPYEEVAYDIYPLENTDPSAGAGMLGEFDDELKENEFLELLKKTLGTPAIRHSRTLGKAIKKVAYCGGAGSFLIPEAIRSGAQAFVSADIKYHQFFDADGKILIADVGHYESEQYTKDLIMHLLKEKFPNFALQISKVNTNAVKYFS